MLPIGKLRGQGGFIQPAALPDGIIGVLNRKRGLGPRHFPRLPLGKRLVMGDQFAAEDVVGPGVKDSMVNVEEQHMFVFCQPQQHGTPQGPVGQIKGATGFLAQQVVQRNLVVRRLEIDPPVRRGEVRLKTERLRWVNYLHRFAVGNGEGGAQNFMAMEDSGNALFQSGDIQRPAQAQGRGNVVGAARFKLLQEPEPLLGKGEGQRLGARRRGYRCPGAVRVGVNLFQTGRQAGDRRLFKEEAQWQVGGEGLAQAVDDASRQEGMAAK